MLEQQVKNDNSAEQLDVLSQVFPEVISAFRRLDEDGRRKLFQMVGTLLGLDSGSGSRPVTGARVEGTSDRFSKDRPITPKEFLLRKQPRTDVERVACLGYYLTHYRDQPHFKTLDISKLNTEAAQIKFSNPAKAVDNAANYGYLAQATKGNKQISAQGEVFVEALPDRDAAHAAMANARPRRKTKRSTPEAN